MFWIFGLFFTLLSGALVVLFVRALVLRDDLVLNARELADTKGDILSWSVVCATGFVSAVLTQLLSAELAPMAAYVYYTLAVTMPLAGWWGNRLRAKAIV